MNSVNTSTKVDLLQSTTRRDLPNEKFYLGRIISRLINQDKGNRSHSNLHPSILWWFCLSPCIHQLIFVLWFHFRCASTSLISYYHKLLVPHQVYIHRPYFSWWFTAGIHPPIKLHHNVCGLPNQMG